MRDVLEAVLERLRADFKHTDGHIHTVFEGVFVLYLYPASLPNQVMVQTWKSEGTYDFPKIARSAYRRIKKRTRDRTKFIYFKSSIIGCEVWVSARPFVSFPKSSS